MREGWEREGARTKTDLADVGNRKQLNVLYIAWAVLVFMRNLKNKWERYTLSVL